MAKQVKMTVRFTVPLEGALVDCIDLCKQIEKHRLEFNPVQQAEVITLALAGGVDPEDMKIHAGNLLSGIKFEAQCLLDKALIDSMVKQ